MNAASTGLPGIDVPEAIAQAALLVGYSGGLDSSVLLHLLASSPQREHGLRAIHVHHGLYPQADAWAAHCQRQCATLDVPLSVVHVNVARDDISGPEAAARAARHAAFAAALHADEALALAHHRDDQAETFLLRALRASGPDGLAAMRPLRRYPPGWLWRPLLDMPRSVLLTYARVHGLQWIEDSSNDDSTFDRNFLRHRVLPLLRGRWPQADAAFARSAALSAHAATLLDGGDAAALTISRDARDGSLEIAALRALPPARRARVLRRWIADAGLPPLPASGVAHIEADLLPARRGASARYAWDRAIVEHWRGRLFARRPQAPLPPGWETTWDGRAPLALPGGDALQLLGAEAFDTPVRVHARRGGERIILPGRRHSHALKHVLQAQGVPPWLRLRLPLLSTPDGKVIAAGDQVLSAALDAWLREHRARLVWKGSKPDSRPNGTARPQSPLPRQGGSTGSAPT